ncbi:hypothetical protein MRS44_013890 [Fusarium solani]|uniref:uncharacterized protein n=1 Tax=Fusarium solani TaxID=169388 RepID=UPI0032C43375|nr:hypothetical protein MRS44_013890 [Fusarium solani]
MTTVCDNCVENVPLDLFLPFSSWHVDHDRVWRLNILLFEGEDAVAKLDASRRRGCPLCNVIWAALESAEPLWATNEFRGTGSKNLLRESRQHASAEEHKPGIKLTVQVEGEMRIKDGRRTSGVYWEMKSKGYGKARAAVRNRADCDENIDMIKGWLGECTEAHESCFTRPGDKTFLPTRVIDIGPSNDSEPIQPRLVMSDFLDPNTTYFALSYCWGTDRGKTVLKTTRDNLPLHLKTIETAKLNRTYIDAMELIRKLGYRYIWIDALCIIQDDRSDFEVECDGDGGCFLPRDAEGAKAVTYRAINQRYRRSLESADYFNAHPDSADLTIYPSFGPWIKGINQGPVFRRGWCLQEREMSPRVLHFTKSRILWECRETIASEDAPEMVSKAARDLELGSYLSTARLLDDEKTTVTLKTKGGTIYEGSKWPRIVEAYSHRSLSVVADKLPAISGLAATVALQRPDDTYLAGIWRSELLKGISWVPAKRAERLPVDGLGSGSDTDTVILSAKALTEPGLRTEEKWPPEPVDPDIPSWSWVAHDGPIRFCGDSWGSVYWTEITVDDDEHKWIKSEVQVDVLSASVNHTGKDPFGRVSGGSFSSEDGWPMCT